MVSPFSPACWELMAVEPTAESVIEQLDPPRRAAVLMALLAFILLGIVLVACVMIGARWVRHLARHHQGPTPERLAAKNRRLRDALRPILPDGRSDETTVFDQSTGDTKVDRDTAN